MTKTTKQIIEESFKNQDFNINKTYDATTVFDTIDWIENPEEKWHSEEEVLAIFDKIKGTKGKSYPIGTFVYMISEQDLEKIKQETLGGKQWKL